MIRAAIGLPADRSGVYGLCQDWLQNHGLGVYEPQRRYGDGTLFNEWTGSRFSFRSATIDMLRRINAPMLVQVGEYYYIRTPKILRNAIPQLKGMRAALTDLGIKAPWLMIDEPPHFALDANGKQRFGWTPEVEAVVTDFVKAAMAAGFGVGVCMPGPSQYAFWRKRISPSWWVLHAEAAWEGYDTSGCWLYNAETYEGLADRLRVIGASGYLQWSGVRTTVKGPVPILFDDKGVATDAAWELVRQLGQAQGPARTVEERLADVERRLAVLEGKRE